jgi:hypothetical protein
MLTTDQQRLLKALAKGSLYQGAVPLCSRLSSERAVVVERQLLRRGLIRTSGPHRQTLEITKAGEVALRAA